jgi:2-polyprenyl-3-methyl-5-hydroxy-6-metoxy-1,4-benzoquinol methylase
MDFGATWNRLHAEHGRKAIDGGANATDEQYWLSGVASADMVCGLAGPPHGKDLLDYGCGDGRIAKAVAPRCKSLVCADASADILARCAANVPTARCLRVDWPQDLPADMTFDIIYSMAVFYHLSNVQGFRVLTGLFARLRPGGVIVFDHCNFYHSYYVSLLSQKAEVGDWSVPWPWVPTSGTEWQHFALAVLHARAVTRHNADAMQSVIVVWK